MHIVLMLAQYVNNMYIFPMMCHNSNHIYDPIDESTRKVSMLPQYIYNGICYNVVHLHSALIFFH